MKKSIHSILIFISFSLNCFAQQLAWRDTISYESRNSISAITSDDQGNIYVAGGSSAGYHESGYPIRLLRKYDPAGNIIWQDTAHENAGIRTLIYHDNAIYVIGNNSSRSLHFGAYTLTKPDTSYNSTFIVKYDLSGNVLWANLQLDVKFIKAALYNNELYLLNYGADVYLNADYFTSNFLEKLDLNGTILSTTSISGVQAIDMSIVNENCIYICTQGGSRSDQYLRRYDINGNLIWNIPTGVFDYSIVSDSAGNCYVSGYSSGTATVAMIDSMANHIGNYYPSSQQITYRVYHSNQDLYASGQISATEYSIVKYGNDTLRYNISMGEMKIECMLRVGNDLYVGGRYSASESFDAYLIKISEAPATAIPEINPMDQELTLYPNPGGGIFNISCLISEKTPIQLHVIDPKGQIIIHENIPAFIGKYVKQIDLSAYAKGFYTIEIIQGNNRQVKKVVVN